MAQRLFGGIEAGGTKFMCAVGAASDTLSAQVEIATGSPAATLEKVAAFFAAQAPVQAIGIGSFGPLDLNRHSATYGFITTTPKLDWVNTDLAGSIARRLRVPVAIDTDVNCAALAERQSGAGQGLDAIAYMTVGTGIGAGCLLSGQIMRGLAHSEIGHMLIPLDPQDTNFGGSCPYHGTCLEGLASGTALRKRWGMPAEDISDQAAWELEAHYLALGIVNLILLAMPQRIIVGGGVMKRAGLIENIRQKIPEILQGYLQIPELTNQLRDYIVAPKLGALSGVTGAIILAQQLDEAD